MKRYGVIECDPLVLDGLDKTVSSMATYSSSRKCGALFILYQFIWNVFLAVVDCKMDSFRKKFSD